MSTGRAYPHFSCVLRRPPSLSLFTSGLCVWPERPLENRRRLSPCGGHWTKPAGRPWLRWLRWLPPGVRCWVALLSPSPCSATTQGPRTSGQIVSSSGELHPLCIIHVYFGADYTLEMYQKARFHAPRGVDGLLIDGWLLFHSYLTGQVTPTLAVPFFVGNLICSPLCPPFVFVIVGGFLVVFFL